MDSNDFQLLKPEFTHLNSPEPITTLYRFDNANSRYYFRFPEGEDEIAYLGATSMVAKILPSGDGLRKYFQTHGEMAYILTRMAAEYGTMMHQLIGEYERKGYVDFTETSRLAYERATSLGFGFEARKWSYHMARNIASWIKFCEDVDFETLAIEMPVYHDEYRCATQVDIYGTMMYNRKRRNVIINLKKGYLDAAREDKKKDYYAEHDLQLQIERVLWEETYPDFPVEMVGNWSPNNWTKSPTYTMKWWDKTAFGRQWLKTYLKLPQDTPGAFNPPSKIPVLEGVYKVGGNIEDNIVWKRMKKV